MHSEILLFNLLNNNSLKFTYLHLTQSIVTFLKQFQSQILAKVRGMNSNIFRLSDTFSYISFFFNKKKKGKYVQTYYHSSVTESTLNTLLLDPRLL